MEKALEKLWYNYLLDECGVINTEEERLAVRKSAELHEKANLLLTDEQKDAVEKFVDALSNAEALFAKKAFIKGCAFAVSFLREARF